MTKTILIGAQPFGQCEECGFRTGYKRNEFECTKAIKKHIWLAHSVRDSFRIDDGSGGQKKTFNNMKDVLEFTKQPLNYVHL